VAVIAPTFAFLFSGNKEESQVAFLDQELKEQKPNDFS
jgi:hypothetical protein